MDDAIPTIRIKDPKKPGDYLIINMSSFDPAVHELWSEQTADTMGTLRALGEEAVASGAATTAEVEADLGGMKELPAAPEFAEEDDGGPQPIEGSPQNQLGLGERPEVSDPSNPNAPATGVRRTVRRSGR